VLASFSSEARFQPWKNKPWTKTGKRPDRLERRIEFRQITEKHPPVFWSGLNELSEQAPALIRISSFLGRQPSELPPCALEPVTNPLGDGRVQASPLPSIALGKLMERAAGPDAKRRFFLAIDDDTGRLRSQGGLQTEHRGWMRFLEGANSNAN